MSSRAEVFEVGSARGCQGGLSKMEGNNWINKTVEIFPFVMKLLYNLYFFSIISFWLAAIQDSQWRKTRVATVTITFARFCTSYLNEQPINPPNQTLIAKTQNWPRKLQRYDMLVYKIWIYMHKIDRSEPYVFSASKSKWFHHSKLNSTQHTEDGNCHGLSKTWGSSAFAFIDCYSRVEGS